MIRLIAGVVFLLVWIIVKRVKIGQWVRTASNVNLWGTVLVVVIIGTDRAIWLAADCVRLRALGMAWNPGVATARVACSSPFSTL